MTNEPKNIHEAILNVWREVEIINKGLTISMGKSGSYKAAGEADFIKTVRPEFIKNKIITYQVLSEVVDCKQRVTKGFDGVDKFQNATILKVVTRFYHVPSDTFIDVQACGEGQDSGDKATPKAETIAQKYAVRKMLFVETGDDPDAERPELQGENKATYSPAPAKTYTPAPKPAQQSLPQSTSYPASVETEDGVINYEDRFQDVQAKFAHKFGAYEAGTMVKDMTAKQLAAFIKDRRWAAENGQEKYRGYAKQDLNAALYFSALVSLPSGTERKENKLVRNMAKEDDIPWDDTKHEDAGDRDDGIPF